MPELILTCARCQRQLRVPEEMQGRMVKCPACEFTFTVAPDSPRFPMAPDQAVVRTDAGEVPASSPASEVLTPSASPERGDHRRALARAMLLPPLICLVIVSTLAFGVSLWLGYNLLQLTDADRQMLIQQMQVQHKNNPQVNQAQVEAMTNLTFILLQVSSAVGILLSPLVIVAAVLGLNQRGYWFAVIGSGLAMLNLGCCSCLLGLPFGIWSLVVLLRPETKALFTQ